MTILSVGLVAAGSAAALLVLAASAPAAVTTQHYQKKIELTCGATVPSVCEGDFAAPGDGRRLKITRISCYLQAVQGATPSTFRYGYITLISNQGVAVLEQYLTGIHTDSLGIFHTLNNAVDMQVGSAQHVRATLVLGVGGTAALANCTAIGTLERLQ